MTEQEIIDGNKLKITDRAEINLIEKFMGYADGYLSENITWNDVMPIVKKIGGCNTVVTIRINRHTTLIRTEVNSFLPKWSKDLTFSEVDILSVWLAVVAFITWYNEQNNKNENQKTD